MDQLAGGGVAGPVRNAPFDQVPRAWLHFQPAKNKLLDKQIVGRRQLFKASGFDDRDKIPSEFRLAGAGENEWKNFPWESSQSSNQSVPVSGEFWEKILRGSYPEPASHPERDARLWQSSYIQTYLERDVRNLRNLGDLTQFQVFLRALAARSTQILNLSDLARDVGVAVNTAKDWISILEASFQVFILRPYYANIGKRLIKSPKVYFTDTGLLCYLVGLRDVEHAAAGPMGGAIFENMVIADLYKSFLHRGEEPPLYYWRTVAGSEVDLIIDTQSGLVPIEIKLSETPRPEMAKELHAFQRDFKKKALPGYVIHPGNTVLPLGQGVASLPLSRL